MVFVRKVKTASGATAVQLAEYAGGRPVSGTPVVQAQASQLLIHTLRSAWNRLGFNEIGDEAFLSLVLARLVEPTSKVDSLRVLTELGYEAPHRNTFTATMKRCATRGYRDVIATKCFAHAATAGDVTLCLYDVTTLYFEAEHEDDLRKVGYSKERRVDPQVVVGLLVDRHGFPLEIGCFEGNRAEATTIIPIVRQFADRHNRPISRSSPTRACCRWPT